jgi:hypothetical protein
MIGKFVGGVTLLWRGRKCHLRLDG